MKTRDLSCSDYVDLIHRVLDADLMDAAIRESLVEHLSNCDECRQADRELRRVQSTLQAMPELKLPDEWLETVFEQTSRAPQPEVRRFGGSTGWRAAAAAAVLAVALWGFWPSGQDSEYSDAQLEQAAAEARMALKMTANALKRSERVGIERVLGAEVSPALKRVPLKLPAAGTAERGEL